MRLGIDGRLSKTLGSTNPIESMIEIVRHPQRNVSAGATVTCESAGPPQDLVAEQQFIRISLPRTRQARHRDRA